VSYVNVTYGKPGDERHALVLASREGEDWVARVYGLTGPPLGAPIRDYTSRGSTEEEAVDNLLQSLNCEVLCE
jgi:hypothetical protein